MSYTQEDRRKPWLETSESTIAVIGLIVTLSIGGIWWGGHIDSQVAQNKADIAFIKGRNDALVEGMDKIKERLIIVETHQSDQIEELHKQSRILDDINANLHRFGH